VLGVSSHRVENWWFYGDGMKLDSDVRDRRFAGLYGPAQDRERSEKGETPPTKEFLDDWLARTAELVDKYQPQLVWFDWWIAQPAVHGHLQRFAAYYYNRGAEWRKGVAINYKKHGATRSPTRPVCSTSSAASSPRCARSSGRTTPRCLRTPGATSRTSSTRTSTRSSTTSSTS
jgi:alpha-L-fucosidase